MILEIQLACIITLRLIFILICRLILKITATMMVKMIGGVPTTSVNFTGFIAINVSNIGFLFIHHKIDLQKMVSIGPLKRVAQTLKPWSLRLH